MGVRASETALQVAEERAYVPHLGTSVTGGWMETARARSAGVDHFAARAASLVLRGASGANSIILIRCARYV